MTAAPSRLWSRSTTRRPGADLSRLPVGLDFRAINLIEGVRAALAIGAIVLLNDWVRWPPMTIAALAAFLTCLCDGGGPVGQRLPALLAFAGIGGLTLGLFGLLQPLGMPVMLPLAGLGILLASSARIWGQMAAQVGAILTVVLIFALDGPLSLPTALEYGGLFFAGGLWAVLLMLVLWQLHPHRPARRAVAEIWRLLAVLAADLREVLDAGPNAGWEAHARAHRRAVRDAIEQARTLVLDTLRVRGAGSARANQGLIRLEAADQLFGAMIALSDLLEHGTDPARLAAGARLLKVLRPMLVVVAGSIETGHIARPDRLERGFARILVETADDPAMHGLAGIIADRLRIAATLATPQGYRADTPNQPGLRLWDRAWAPVMANLSWQSAILRHATRAAVVGMLSLAITMVWPGPFQHWLPITAVLTMQPFFTATWQRALERVAGTLLGAALGSFLAVWAHSPTSLALIMLPLSVVTFAMRQVSYGAFIACLTPWVIVFIEAVEPGHSQWVIAFWRALFTVSGGLLAVGASLVLWPSWEGDRLGAELGRTVAAHAAYARAALAALLDKPTGTEQRRGAEPARRAAGMASTNLEASLSRALHEPRHRDATRLEAALVADAALRRVAGRLSALQHDPAERQAMDPTAWARWRDWIIGALDALADRRPPAEAPSDKPGSEAVGRLARQIDLLDGALRRFRIS